jgi:heme/copper-type cytochrome/quinol oxidase subunit 2
VTFDRQPDVHRLADWTGATGWLGLLLGMVLLLHGVAAANDEDPAPPAEPTVTPVEVAPTTAPAIPIAPADEEQARRRAFSTGVVMLGVILICGVALIAIVLLWGNRTRRIARQALPKVSPRDELWFLKHKIESEARRLDRDKNDDSSTDPKA